MMTQKLMYLIQVNQPLVEELVGCCTASCRTVGRKTSAPPQSARSGFETFLLQSDTYNTQKTA